MGVDVYKARAPGKGFASVRIAGVKHSEAVIEYAYKVSFDWEFNDQLKSRFLGPTRRAWERWIKQGKVVPKYILLRGVEDGVRFDRDRIFFWPRVFSWYDAEWTSWEEVA